MDTEYSCSEIQIQMESSLVYTVDYQSINNKTALAGVT